MNRSADRQRILSALADELLRAREAKKQPPGGKRSINQHFPYGPDPDIGSSQPKGEQQEVLNELLARLARRDKGLAD